MALDGKAPPYAGVVRILTARPQDVQLRINDIPIKLNPIDGKSFASDHINRPDYDAGGRKERCLTGENGSSGNADGVVSCAERDPGVDSGTTLRFRIDGELSLH